MVYLGRAPDMLRPRPKGSNIQVTYSYYSQNKVNCKQRSTAKENYGWQQCCCSWLQCEREWVELDRVFEVLPAGAGNWGNDWEEFPGYLQNFGHNGLSLCSLKSISGDYFNINIYLFPFLPCPSASIFYELFNLPPTLLPHTWQFLPTCHCTAHNDVYPQKQVNSAHWNTFRYFGLDGLEWSHQHLWYESPLWKKPLIFSTNRLHTLDHSALCKVAMTF